MACTGTSNNVLDTLFPLSPLFLPLMQPCVPKCCAFGHVFDAASQSCTPDESREQMMDGKKERSFSPDVFEAKFPHRRVEDGKAEQVKEQGGKRGNLRALEFLLNYEITCTSKVKTL